MKKLVMLFVFMAVVPGARAADVEFLGQKGFHYQSLHEACFNPNAGLGATTFCTSVPVVMVPDWNFAPFTLGGAFGGSTPILTVGAAENLMPAAKAVFLLGLNAVSGPGSMQNLKYLLSPPKPGASPDVIINFGAKWGAQMTSSSRLKGVFLLSVGPSILFN